MTRAEAVSLLVLGLIGWVMVLAIRARLRSLLTGGGKKKATAMGSVGHAPAGIIRIERPKQSHPWLRAGALWSGRRLIRAVHTQPTWTMWSSLVGGVVLCATLLVLGWPTVLAYGPLAPATVVALWAALVQRKQSNLDGNAAIWARLSEESIGPDGKPRMPKLAGSRVKGRVVYEREGDVVRRFGLLVRGWDQATTYARIAAERESIAAAYLVPVQCVDVVRYEDEAHAMVWVTTKEWMAKVEAEKADRLAQVHRLTHTAGFKAGSVDVAVQVASGGSAFYRIFTQDVGAHHGQLVGRTRSGKSEGAHTLYKVACSSGLVVPHIADLAGGVSLQWWEERAASYATTVEETKALIRALDREYDQRILYMRREGLRVLNPSGDWPHHRLFVDEAPELAQDKEAMALIGKALRMWAKANMAVDWASQAGHVSQAWGKDTGTALSEQMANLWAFGAGRQTSNIVMHGTELDLGQIPRGVPGASFLMSPDHPEPVLVRARYDAKPDPRWLAIPSFRWPAEPVLASPTLAPERPLEVVRHIDPTERIRAALKARPMTVNELAEATHLDSKKVRRLVESTRGIVSDGARYNMKWSLVEVQS